MFTLFIVDASAKRRSEVALALQSLGGIQTVLFASSEAIKRSTVKADAILVPVNQPLPIQTDVPIILFGESKPTRKTNHPFVSLYPLPACIENIRKLVLARKPNDK